MGHLFLADAGHEEDVVVLADRDQDREEECWNLPVESREAGRIEREEERKRGSECYQIAEENADDQVDGDCYLTKKRDQNQENSRKHKTIDNSLVTISDRFQVSNTCRWSDSVNVDLRVR